MASEVKTETERRQFTAPLGSTHRNEHVQLLVSIGNVSGGIGRRTGLWSGVPLRRQEQAKQESAVGQVANWLSVSKQRETIMQGDYTSSDAA